MRLFKMNLQIEFDRISQKFSALNAARLDCERQHARLSSSIALAGLQQGERALAPLKRGQLIQRISQIDRELAKAEDERRQLNAAHLAAAAIARKPSVKPTTDMRLAIKTVETLKQRRVTIAEQLSDVDQRRAKIILSATTGDAKAKAAANDLSGELINLAREASDIDLAITQAHELLRVAQTDADKIAVDDRAAQAAKISAAAVGLAVECDQHLRAAAAIFEQCAGLHKQVIKLGQLSDINSRRLANPRVAEQALIAAGLKPFIPTLGSAIATKPNTLADSYRNLFPHVGRDAGKAA
jgi:hypothetical protein